MKKRIWILFLLLFSVSCSKSEKIVKIGYDPTWYPKDFQKMQPNVNAYVEDLLLSLSKIMEVHFQKIEKGELQLFEDLQDHQYAAVLSSKKPYVFNEKKYCFSNIFLNTGPVLVIDEDQQFFDLDTFEGKIGVIAGESTVLFLERYPNILMQTYTNIPDLCNAIEEENIQAGLIYHIIAEGYIQNNYYQRLKISKPLIEEGLRLITLYGEETRLVDRFNKALKTMQKDGSLEALKAKWNIY